MQQKPKRKRSWKRRAAAAATAEAMGKRGAALKSGALRMVGCLLPRRLRACRAPLANVLTPCTPCKRHYAVHTLQTS